MKINLINYFIMKSTHASGFLLRAFTTGPYSCGSAPYCANISATSAASVHWSIFVNINFRFYYDN